VLENADSEIPYNPDCEAAVHVSRAVLEAEREELLRLRDSWRLHDSRLRVLERELDHQETCSPPAPGDEHAERPLDPIERALSVYLSSRLRHWTARRWVRTVPATRLTTTQPARIAIDWVVSVPWARLMTAFDGSIFSPTSGLNWLTTGITPRITR
jgi:hypothetical protein